MSVGLFDKISIGNLVLENRINVAPMCQYSAKNGSPSKWHYSHLLKLLTSGSSMLMLESTAVNNTGKISHADLCLKTKKQSRDFKKLVTFLKSYSKKIPISLQISHSGRKGSSHIPWVKSNTALKKTQKSYRKRCYFRTLCFREKN